MSQTPRPRGTLVAGDVAVGAAFGAAAEDAGGGILPDDLSAPETTAV